MSFARCLFRSTAQVAARSADALIWRWAPETARWESCKRTAAGFNFTVNLYLIPHYGWLGAAWSSLATDGLLAVLNWTALAFLQVQANKLATASTLVRR